MPPNKSSDTTLVALPCRQCTRSFVNGTALAAHHRSKHAIPVTIMSPATIVSTTNKNQLVPCTVAGCAQTFPTRRALGLHLESPTHARKRGMPLQNLGTSRHTPSSLDGSCEVYPNTSSNTPDSIPELNVELTAPVVIAEASTTSDSLTSQFESSLYISAHPQSVTGESSSVPRALREGAFARERPLTNFIPENRADRKPKLPARRTQPARRWTIIPEQQQYMALTALRLRCHPPTVLKANAYTPYTDHVNFIGEDAIPVPLGAPTHHWQVLKRTAIALDCEMVGVGDNSESEIARISAIDYLTGEILIDTLVQPTRAVMDWRTQYSGITNEAMAAAFSQGKTLNGWPDARASLFKHIDTETVLVGQALHFDLIALGIQHQRVVDSAILASEAVGRGVKRRWGLKDLCDQLLHIKIQTDNKAGHDSVEDAFAAREIVLWCINHPSALEKWATKRRNEYTFQKKKKKKQKTKTDAVSQRQHPSYLGVNVYDHDEEAEILRWSDIAEELGWPHPDTGYDPWSD